MITLIAIDRYLIITKTSKNTCKIYEYEKNLLACHHVCRVGSYSIIVVHMYKNKRTMVGIKCCTDNCFLHFMYTRDRLYQELGLESLSDRRLYRRLVLFF